MTTGSERYYRERAQEYDLVYAKPERQSDLQSMRSWLPSRMQERRVLEIAAGTGYWTDVYGDEATTVVATDVNETTLEVARSRRKWPTSTSFVVADAFDLDAVGGDFDAAFVGFFWSHVSVGDLDQFLNGIGRRLGSGALGVFVDNRYVEGSNQPVTRTDAEGNTYQARTLLDGTLWEVRKNFPTSAEVYSKLKRVASSVEIHEWAYYWAATCTFD
jgi:demethylmenaquinone methyltransferase/2-methoxy-6-polyprenyl-1,4-benzoquinol methylase